MAVGKVPDCQSSGECPPKAHAYGCPLNTSRRKEQDDTTKMMNLLAGNKQPGTYSHAQFSAEHMTLWNVDPLDSSKKIDVVVSPLPPPVPSTPTTPTVTPSVQQSK